jgi:hypothetical protein
MFNKEPTLEGLVASGRVKVVSLSGNTAKVKGETVSYFDMTPPPNFIVPQTGAPAQGDQSGGTGSQGGQTGGGGSQASGAGNTGPGSVFDQAGLSILSPFTAGTVTAALRALQAPEPVTVTIGRNLSLDITPHSLAEASSAELALKLTVTQPAPAVVVGTGNDHLLDRIAKAEVETRVRIPGARLFEISNFALDVQAPRPDGIFPIVGHAWNGVFGRVPVLNRFFKWKREPATVYHRNLVVVSAIIAPTAADLSLGLRFHRDVLTGEVRHDAKKAKHCLNALLREHQRKIHSLLGLDASPSDEGALRRACDLEQ